MAKRPFYGGHPLNKTIIVPQLQAALEGLDDECRDRQQQPAPQNKRPDEQAHRVGFGSVPKETSLIVVTALTPENHNKRDTKGERDACQIMIRGFIH